MPRYDFACECGEITEVWAGFETDSLLCPRCGALAHRLAVYQDQYTITESGGHSYPSHNAKDGKGRYRVLDFQEASAEIDHACFEAERKEGKPIKLPNLYKKGLSRARWPRG